ncbi:MAG: pentapeptide repeat-containing protein [Bacteroidota bacterium]|nr:pentapeptide repeat-containing protein [Bacteroidota bacterium]
MTIKWKSILVTIFLALLSATTLFLLYQNNKLKSQADQDRKVIELQKTWIDSIRTMDQLAMMSLILKNVDEELAQHPQRILSDNIIARIAALSYSLKPHVVDLRDTMQAHLLSPERGQLLLMLSRMKMDTGSFQKILLQTTFADADLEKANFQSVDLRWANLAGANLRDANLQSANLYETDLKSAMLWGANLQKANLQGTYLTRADMRWSNMNEADLRRADLFGADLSSAQLHKANFLNAILQWSVLDDAYLTEADLSGVFMFRTSLKRTQLQQAILRETNLSWADLTEANLSDADITGCTLSNAELNNLVIKEKHWIESLFQFGVHGAEAIRTKYQIIDESSDTAFQYRLQKK